MGKLRLPIIFSSDERDPAKYTTSDFTVQFQNAFNFSNGSDFYLSVNKLSTWYSYPNISAANGTNIFTYSDGTTTYNHTIPDGIYDSEDLTNVIHSFMFDDGHYTGVAPDYVFPIRITANVNIGKFLFEIDAPYSIDFTTSSLYRLFGTTSSVKSADFTAEGRGDMTDGINAVYVNCDFCYNSALVGGNHSSVIYAFSVDVSPYQSIVEAPTIRTMTQITSGRPKSVRIWLTDNLGRPIDLRGEAFSLNAEIIEV